jgi:general secretion pathway protein N
MPLLQKRYWSIITILLTLFFIVRLFPASWLIYGVQQVAPAFQVSGVSGTLWQGRAEYVQWADRGHALPLGELKWQLSAFSLLALKPCVQFSSGFGAQYLKGNICYAWVDRVVLGEGIDIALPIANIAPFFGVNLGGDINAFLDSAELRQGQLVNVDASLRWLGASVYNGSEWLDLGSIQSRFRDDYSGLISEWRHLEQAGLVAPVEVNIRVDVVDVLATAPTVKVKGFIKPSAQNSGLNPMLQFMGNKDNDGFYRIDFTE